jgi:ABC-type amino acid transport substrate-binding protein
MGKMRLSVIAIASRANSAIKSWADIDQSGRVVVVQKGTFMEPLMRRTLVRASLLGASRPAEREVGSGRADVLITNYPYSQRMLANADGARIIAPDQPMQPTDYAYAVPKGDSVWLDRVDRFVSRIKQDGRLAVVAGRHNLLPIVVRD